MDIPSPRSSELFASVTDGQVQEFFRLQGKRRINEEYRAYDSTSISSYSETLNQVRYGKNKEHDKLPQLNLLLVFGEKSGLPFYYRKLAGNIPDSKTDLYKKYTTHQLLDNLDVIECFEDEGRRLRIGEVLEKQLSIYKALKIKPPSSSC